MWLITFIDIIKVGSRMGAAHSNRLKAPEPARRLLAFLQTDDLSVRTFGIRKRVFNRFLGIWCELRIPSVVLVFCIEEDYVMNIAIPSGVVVRTRSTPHYFVQKILLPEDLIENLLCVVCDVVIQMHIKTASIVKQFM